MRRRTLLEMTGAALGLAMAGCITRSDDGSSLTVSSPAFEDGATIPRRFACDGRGISPPLTIDSVPTKATTLAVVGRSTVGVLDNPIFWTLWNVPAETTEIPAGLARTETVDALDGASQGTAGDGEPGYRPLCPPPEQAYDHWVQVYALDSELSVAPGTTNDDATDAIGDNQLASQRITASYTRRATPSE
jgi:Raf kinase inhibitor-like YbhB/YbcL family protein